jgi:dolichyl-diphosphooligosaccharide--protein glycosyltransferase
MSTPEDAWQILMSDTETDVSSYYVTLPADALHPTRHSDGTFNESQWKLEEFAVWKESDCTSSEYSCVKQSGKFIDPNEVAKYPTLFDYWESEIYVIPPVITGLDADYIIINLAVEKLGEDNIMDLYLLNQRGGDETKAFWFFKIADLSVLDYYNPELTSYTDKFWDDTLFAKLIPFTPILYVDPDNSERQSETFRPGYTAIYVKNIKFPADGDGPFQLVYVSPSFEMDAPGPLTGPLIYKINKEYNPNQ